MNSSSIELNNILTKDIKKKYGIFFSPLSIIDNFYTKMKSYLQINSNYDFLEPSCGSCEFVDKIQKDTQFSNNYSIDAIELNDIIFENICQIKRNHVSYIHTDFLYYDILHTKKYDMIIGNPPYFVYSDDLPQHLKGKNKSETYYEGRIQIYVLFILHSLEKLKENGILGFILPKSILNSSYYMKTRKYIYEKYELLEIIDYGNIKFDDTSQETIGIIIRNNQNTKSDEKYVFKIDKNIFFTTEKEKLEKYYKKSSTLDKLGFSVKTGPVVWNQHKDKVTNDSNHSLLLYNTNIEKNKIVLKNFKNNEKGQYIDFNENIETLPIIVINRGNGNSKYKLNISYIDETVLEELNVKSVCVENHLNVIYYNRKDKSNDEIKCIMKKIYEKLENSKEIKEWCSIFLGNNGFSKTELQFYLPISL